MKQNPRNRSRKIALGGVCAALAIVVMLVGGLLPLSTFSAPVLASLLLVPLTVELGNKIPFICYGAAALLSLLLMPNRESALLFLLFAGYYPIAQPVFLKITFKPLRILLKLLLFNISVLITYSILLFLFVSPSVQQEFSESAPWFLALTLFVGNILFVLYDILIDKVRTIYIYQLRNKIFK